jgi:FlgD Ig-like domain
MKHFSIITVILVIFMFSSIMAAEVNTLAAAKVQVENDKLIVPIELTNVQPMAALDLPLKYSKGVTLEEVTFDGTRSENFDFKYASIDVANSQVIIGMIPMVFGNKNDLEPGSGVVANLVFRIDDPSLESVELAPIVTKNPDHSLMYVYNEGTEIKSMEPEISGLVVALNGGATTPESALPTKFALKQNAPNPFNPTTMVSYDLPKPANVRLEIFNVLGQRVKTLVDGYQEAGSKSVMWDGTDRSGSSVASGIYFYRIQAGENTATMKMMMLK